MTNEEPEVPAPPSVAEELRKRSGLPPRTVMDELHFQFEARLRANHGRLVPLTAEELARGAPEPPDISEVLRNQGKGK